MIFPISVLPLPTDLPPFLRRILSRTFPSLVPTVFQTPVGVKYRSIRFDSARFAEYVVDEVVLPASSQAFSDVVLPPDLLKDRYTSSGLGVVYSPHYRLMADIASARLTPGSEYLDRCRAGTLDSRSPFEPKLGALIATYQQREEELARDGAVAVSAVAVSLEGRRRYIVIDGKHRAALSAFLGRPEALRLRLVSRRFLKETFFERLYSFTLRLRSRDYSVNHTLIKALIDESRP